MARCIIFLLVKDGAHGGLTASNMQVLRRLHVGSASITLYCVQQLLLLARISSLGRLCTLQLAALGPVRKLGCDLGIDGRLTLSRSMSQILDTMLQRCAAVVHLSVEHLGTFHVSRHEGATLIVFLSARH